MVYDQYNGGNSWCDYRVHVRPFPFVKTPIYKERYDDKEASYEVVEGNNILSQFVDLDRAKEYASAYVTKNLHIDLVKKCIGNEDSEFIEAYDTNYNPEK